MFAPQNVIMTLKFNLVFLKKEKTITSLRIHYAYHQTHDYTFSLYSYVIITLSRNNACSELRHQAETTCVPNGVITFLSRDYVCSQTRNYVQFVNKRVPKLVIITLTHDYAWYQTCDYESTTQLRFIWNTQLRIDTMAPLSWQSTNYGLYCERAHFSVPLPMRKRITGSNGGHFGLVNIVNIQNSFNVYSVMGNT